VAISAISSCVLSYVTREGGREDITPRNTSDNTFTGRNVYTTDKQGAKANLCLELSNDLSLETYSKVHFEFMICTLS
jgi:hypothetical protein